MKYDTLEKISKAIREIHIQKQPLNISAVRNSHPELLAAVYEIKPFLGWKQALGLAGLKYRSIHTSYIDQIPCLICGDYFSLLGSHLLLIHQVSTEEYRDEYPGADMVCETLRFRRVTASSRHKDHIPDWEPASSVEYAFDKVYEYHKCGHHLNFSNMLAVDSGMTIPLMKAHPGGWDDVLEIIGVEPVAHRRVIRDDDFTLKDFAKWLRTREKEGLKNTREAIIDLHQTDIDGASDLKQRIISWALHSHGHSWLRALDASGVDLSHPAYNERNFPDDESLIVAIREIAAAGRPTAHIEVIRHPEDSLLSFTAAKQFGSWTKALEKAGVEATYEQRELQGKSHILAHLRKRLRNGFPVAVADMWAGSRRDPELFKAAFKSYPDWCAAVKIASRNDSQLIKEANRNNPFTNKNSIIKELQKLHRAKLLLAERRLQKNPRTIHLIAMAHGFFGSWQSAVLAAGIDPKSYHQKNLNPSSQYPSEESVLKGIIRRKKVGDAMNARSLTVGEKMDQPLIYSARKYFGSWEDALRAAGLDYAKIALKKQDYSRELIVNHYKSKDDVIDGILKRQKTGQKLNSRTLIHDPKDRDFTLMRVAKDLFGSWDAALEAAGLNPADIRRKRPSIIKNSSKF